MSTAADCNRGAMYMSVRNITQRASVPKTADMLTLRLLALFGSFIVLIAHHTTPHHVVFIGACLQVR